MNAQILEALFSKPILEAVDGSDGKKQYVVSGPFTMADRVNGNGRIYPKEVLNKAIAGLREMVKAKRVKMSMDHADFSVGTLKDTAALLTDVSDVQDDGFAYYKAQILDTTKGKDLKVILDAGAMVGVSTVAIGNFLDDQDYPGVEGKHPVMQDGMCLKKVDFVDDPSVSETEGRMQLESKTGACYFYKLTTVNENKEKTMKTLEELKKEFPVIVEFENRLLDEKKAVETKLAESITKLEASEKSVSELTGKVTSLETKMTEMVDGIKKVFPESFTQTVVPESDVTKQKDAEIATLKSEAVALNEKLVKATESVSSFEKKVTESEKSQAIATLQASDPDYFKNKTAVKAFENCLNAEEVKKVYENNKAIMKDMVVAASGSTTPEPGKTQVPEANTSVTLSLEELKELNFKNLSRVSMGLPRITAENFKAQSK